MKFHAFHFRWQLHYAGEWIALLGLAAGRVSFEPQYRWLYSLRIFLLVFRFEILWKTGPLQHEQARG